MLTSRTPNYSALLPLPARVPRVLSPSPLVLLSPGLQTTVYHVLAFRQAVPSPLAWSLVQPSQSELPGVVALDEHGTRKT